MIAASRCRLQSWTRSLVSVGSVLRISFPMIRPFSSASFRLESTKKRGPSPPSSIMLPVVTKERLKTMATAEICLYMKAKKNDSYDVYPLVFELAERDDVFSDVEVFAVSDSQELELAVRSLFKQRRYASVNSFLKTILLRHEQVFFTPLTTEMLFESMITEKDYELADVLWTICSPHDRRNWRIRSLYIRALLGSHRMAEASPFIQSIQKNAYRIASANACILLGLYEGAYYSECLSFYNNLLASDRDLKHLPDPRGFFATILSAYKLHDYPQMISVYSHVSARNVWASREVVYAMTDVFLRGDFWKPAFQRRMKELGSVDEPTQLRVLAQSRLPQLLQGAKIMGDFCRRNKESVVTRVAKGDLVVKVFTYGEVQRQMRLIDALVDVSEHFAMSEVEGRCLVVKTVKKDVVLEKLLQKELFPPIRCSVHGIYLKVPISDIRSWYTKKDIASSL